MIINDISWNVMIKLIVLSWKILEYHQTSSNVTKCHIVSFNMVTFNDIWWQIMMIGDVSWYFLITKNVSFNMVTFGDISWKFMTWQNPFGEVYFCCSFWCELEIIDNPSGMLMPQSWWKWTETMLCLSSRVNRTEQYSRRIKRLTVQCSLSGPGIETFRYISLHISWCLG